MNLQDCHPHTQALLTFLQTAYPEAATILEAAIRSDYRPEIDELTADDFVRQNADAPPYNVKSLLIWKQTANYLNLPEIDFLTICNLLEYKDWETLNESR